MRKQREALQVALDALIEVTGWQWVGPMRVMDEVEDAIAAIREALVEPEQQMATVTGWYGGYPVIEPTDGWIPTVGTVLYSAPAARKPLTDEQLRKLARDAGIKLMNDEALALGYLPAAIKKFARAIERAHGITND